MILLQAWSPINYIVESHVPDGSGKIVAYFNVLSNMLRDESLLLFEDLLSLAGGDGVHLVDQHKELGVWREFLQLFYGLSKHAEFSTFH